MLTVLFATAAVLFLVAYRFYGRFLERRLEIADAPTPAHTAYDGVDRVPAHPAVLFGHHFSSIAGAGPIVGPIIAGLAFGWLPAFLWVVLGAIFIGGAHDLAALVASLRHNARSVAEIAREYISPLSYRLFLAFIWLALIYILVVFTDLTSDTFVRDGGVATSSWLFIALAIGFGTAVYRLKVRVIPASLVFVPLVFVGVWIGQKLPLSATMIPAILGSPAKTWDLVLILYCFVASTLPVWFLLQPRDYLSSYLLYASVAAGFLGLLLGGFDLRYPAFLSWNAPQLGPLFPLLFITVACGACSGFHSLVASGTSSKQLDRERHARPVVYGAMLVEGIVAVIALATLAMLPQGDLLAGKTPLVVYGTGLGRFLSVLGIPQEVGFSFGLLALSTFILTTLDTATRLARFIVEEFFGLSGARWRYLSTAVTLVLPTILVLVTLRDPQGNPMPAWKAIWPVFGATNQLLAGLTLLVVAVWLRKRGRSVSFVALPMVFMLGMTLWALGLLVARYGPTLIGGIAAALFVLACLVIVEALRTLSRPRALTPARA